MNQFKDDLRRALREPTPSADLAQRVLDRASQERRWSRMPQTVKIAAAIGVIAVLSTMGLRYERIREERIANQRAMEQVVEAFRLTEQQLKPFRKSLEALQTVTISIPQQEGRERDRGGQAK
jgi:hypothetical protein